MTQIDRYILALYLRTFLVCFVSLASIFIVFHAFTNLNEMVELAQRRGASLSSVMASYYGPHLLQLFEWTGAIISLMTMLFVVAWLKRTGELTATLAAGVSHGRILRMMVVAALAVVSLQAVSRELLLPSMRDALTLSSDLTGDAPQPILPNYDKVNGILLEGKSVRPRSRLIIEPSFRLDADYGAFGQSLAAKQAQWLPADTEHPEGYLLGEVKLPANINDLPSCGHGERLVLMTGQDQDWIPPDHCFVATTVNTEILHANLRSTRRCSTLHLFDRLTNPAIHNSNDIRVLIHERLVKVPLDFSLFLLGIPLVVNRRDRKLFLMAALAIGTVVIFMGVKTAATMMGVGGYWLSPAVAAWLPLLIFGPIGYTWLREVETV